LDNKNGETEMVKKNNEEHSNKDTAKNLEVRIVNLKQMRIASVRVISKSPENDAWQKLRTWAEPKGLFENVEEHPVFGFNNPPPSPSQKEYGYEFWICIGPDVEVEGEIELKDFPGGLYAVATCTNLADVGETWMRLWNWVNADKCIYKWRKTHELEKPHDPVASQENLVLDLYLPIE
jgi:DNA gyrase inhibitor GyrI